MSSSFNLRDKVCNSLTPWMLSASLFQRVRAPSAQKGLHHECEVLRSDPEWDFVNSYFFQHAPLTYSIKRIFCVHNPSQTEQFEASLKTMDGEAQNPIFAPKWDKEDPTGCRAKVMARWRESAFSSAVVVRTGSRNEFLSHVFVFPYWHGSHQEKVQSICDTGFAYFGKHNCDKGDKGPSTDVGFFGSGIYFTNSARYAADIYSSGHLLLAWVSMRSPYPVIEEDDPDSPSDREKLQGRHAFENYDAHYIPVIAVNTSDPMCPNYIPCRKDQSPMWDEIVVFQKSQTLPRFYVELMVTLPTTPDSPLAMLTQLLKYLQQLSNEPEIIKNSQLLSLFQQKKQLLFVIGDTSHLSSVDQKFFDLVRQLQTGAAKLNDCIIQRFLALIPSPEPFPPPPSPVLPSPLPAPAATQFPATFLPSPFDIPPMLERSVPSEAILEAAGIKKEEDLTPLGPLVRRILAWPWIYCPICAGREMPSLEFGALTSVLLLENGQMVTGDSYSVRAWDPLSGRCLRLFKKDFSLPRFSDKVLSLGKERLLFLRNQRKLVIWDVYADEVLQRFRLPSHGSYKIDDSHKIDDFILLKNGYLATISQTNYNKATICLWNLLTGECQEAFMEDCFGDPKLFSMGKDYLVITHGSKNNCVIIWSLNEKKCIFSESALDFCLSDEEVVCSPYNGLFVFNPSKPFSEGQRGKPKQLIEHEGVLCCCRLKDGQVISGLRDKTLKIWDTQSCQCVKTLEGGRIPVTKIWELKNGLIVSRGEDNTLGVWDLRSGKLLQEFFSAQFIESVEEIGDGKILVVSKTNTAIFDLTRGVRVCTFPGKSRCLKEGFILCHSGYALQSIDPTDGRILRTFGSSIISSPTAPYQLPDGRKLVISDSSIFLEERGVFQCVAPNMNPEPLLFLKGGLVLVTKDGNFQVVNPKTGEVLNTFPCREHRKLISVLNNKFVTLWSDHTHSWVDIWDKKCDQIIKSLHLKKNSFYCGNDSANLFFLSENVRFLARRFGERLRVFSEESAVFKVSFYYQAVELQNGGIVGVSKDYFLKVWDTKGHCLRVLKGHVKKISFAIELRGNRLISGSEDGILKIWDLQSGEVLCTLKGHANKITAICELKDGLIASADRNGELKVWSPQGKSLYDFHLSPQVSSILSLKDGRFATFSVDGKYRIWNPKNGKCEQVVETHLEGSFYLTQHEDGNLSIFRVSKYELYECEIFDLRMGKALERPLIAQKSFRISKEKMISFFNGRIVLWDLASGKCICQMQAPSARVKDCIFLQDGSFLIGFADGTLQKWKQIGEDCVKTWERNSWITALLQLRDGRIVIGSCFFSSGEKHFTLKVWSPDMEECLSTWDGYNGGALLQLEDGSLINEHHKGVGWNVKTGQLIYPSVDFEWIRYKRKIQDFERFCGLNWDQGFYKLLDLSQGSDLQWVLENEVHQLQVGLDLREGFLVYEDSHLQILDPKTNILLRSFKDTKHVEAVCLLKDGSLATADYFASPPWQRVEKVKVNVWDPHTGKCLRVVDLPRLKELNEPLIIRWFRVLEEVVPRKISSSILKIWNSLPETCKASFQKDDECFSMIQLEDRSFAFSSQDKIEIWNKEANKHLEVLGGNFLEKEEVLKGTLLLQDGFILNWLEGNSAIRIWNPVDGKIVQVLRGHPNFVTCAIQLQGGLVVSGSKDCLKVWDLKSGNCLQTLQSHQGIITSILQLSEDTVLSGSEDGTLKVWNFVGGKCLKTLCCREEQMPTRWQQEVGYQNLLVHSLFQFQDGRILSRSKIGDNCDLLRLWDLKRGVPIRSLIVQNGVFDQIRFQDQVLGKEKIHLDLWHPFLMPLPFPDLFSSIVPFLNRLEELVKEEILKIELPMGTQYKCQWTKKLLQNPVRLKCGHIFEAVAFEKQECPICKAPIQGSVYIDLKLQETVAAAIKKYSIPKMAVVPVVEEPDKVSALQAQARLHAEQKEFAKALDKYYEALQFTNRSSAYLPIVQILKDHFPEQVPLALLHFAGVQAKEEDLLGTQETLCSFSKLSTCPELFELLGECALLAQELLNALFFYVKAVEQYESKEDLIRGYEKILAVNFFNFPLYEKLLQLYEEKEKKIALLYIGILFFREKEPEKAKALVEQAEKLDPANPLFSWIYNHVDPYFLSFWTIMT